MHGMAKLSPEQEAQAAIIAEAMRQALNPTRNEALSLQERPPGKPERRVQCVSPSGATFTAVIDEHPQMPLGRVVRLDEYRYPASQILRDAGYPTQDGPDAFAFPQGMTVRQPDASGRPTQSLSQDARRYVADRTHLADFRAYVGREFDPTISVERQKEIAAMREKELAAMRAASRKSQ
jgi:hypothetical protein